MVITQPDREALVHYLSHFDDRLKLLERQREKLLYSYLSLRTIIGLLGMCLPFVVSLGALVFYQTGFQSSISAYYHTGMRDVLVGTLWAIGFFLFSYKGYSRVDEIAGKLSCVFAIGVAVFPTAPDGASDSRVLLIGAFHLIFAALLFLTLTYYCLFLFTKTDANLQPTKRKLQRNLVYRLSGNTMLTCILLMAVYHFLPQELARMFAVSKPIYWLEALAIFAFGISWFVKGEAILKDDS